ncbi:MAG: methyltransferase [Luteolibacter sp.]
MSDPVLDLYQSSVYQAMSHPSTDPAVTAVAARLAGLEVAAPVEARFLEIGCAAGHNLLPLAARWPGGHFVGIDFSTAAIQEARETAAHAGLHNVEFIETDLRAYDPGGGVAFDFIIAHGVYSWVPEDVRQGLMDLCTARLSANGLALISYNTLPGWSLRKTLVGLTNRLAASGATGGDPEEILAFLATAAGNHSAYARHLTSVLHAMFGKGAGPLMFDDFGPVNDPCTFLDFTDHAARSGLRYLAESQLVDDLPGSLAPGSMEILKPLAKAPLALQQTIDVLTNRTFRRSLVCRADAPVREQMSAAGVLDFSVRCPHMVERIAGGVRVVNRQGEELARFAIPAAVAFFSNVSATQSVPVREVIGLMPEGLDPHRRLPQMIVDWARRGLVLLRDEPLRFDAVTPAFPHLGSLRLIAARRGQPLTDLYHTPCLLEGAWRQIATAMDGTRPVEELAALAKTIDPKLDFGTWLSHLAARGMFC